MCNFLSAIVLKNLDVIWDYKCSGHVVFKFHNRHE